MVKENTNKNSIQIWTVLPLFDQVLHMTLFKMCLPVIQSWLNVNVHVNLQCLGHITLADSSNLLHFEL